MNLSLADTATVLGKSERQIRYLIRQERLPARKVGGRWVIDSADLPLTERQRAEIAQRTETARQAFEQGIAPATKATRDERKSYSVTDLDAFGIGLRTLRKMQSTHTPEDHTHSLVLTALEDLARGCHAFDPDAKSRHFSQARDAAARLLVHLLVPATASECSRELVQEIESQWIPKISGLIAAQEKRARRTGLGRLRRATREARV
ncbi:MAG: helix-turn-helix domain-containing protein [Planctomycetota bacterium]